MLSRKYLPNQENDEYAVLFLRRHWFIAFKHLIFYGLLAVLPFTLFYVLNRTIDIEYSNVKLAFLYLGASIYYLYIWLYFFTAMLDFHLDVWIVTNKRIVNIEQKGLFARVISEQRLSRIQDVTSEVEGFFPTLLGYGNVHVQTAGTVSRFIFKEIPDARNVAKQIIVLSNKRKQKESGQPE